MADTSLPRAYLCPRIDRPIALTGRLDDPAWASAPWTEDFEDILGGAAPKPRWRTRAKMLWDAEHLYIGAELEEPNVWATLTQHDSVIFHDNDFEVFLDPDGDHHLYAELELNALNTTWDLLLVRPYREGGPAIDGFELAGLKTAVHVDGTLNDPTDTDRGWTVEIAIPFAALKQIASCPCPPAAGDVWRINFSRVEWDVTVEGGKTTKVPNRPENNWVWSPQGVIDMHRPERWGLLRFVDGTKTWPRPTIPEAAQVLDQVYQLQRAFRERNGRWATSPEALGMAPTPGLAIQATDLKYHARLDGWMIDNEQRLTRSRALPTE